MKKNNKNDFIVILRRINDELTLRLSLVSMRRPCIYLYQVKMSYRPFGFMTNLYTDSNGVQYFLTH